MEQTSRRWMEATERSLQGGISVGELNRFETMFGVGIALFTRQSADKQSVLWGKWGCPRGAWIEWCISCRTRNAVTWTSWCSRQSAVTIVRSYLQTASHCEIMLSTVGLHAENAIANSNISPYWRGTKGTPDVTLSRGQRRSVTSAGQTLTSRPHTRPISSCVAMREYAGHHPHHIRTLWMARTGIWWKEAKVSCPREQSEISFRCWQKWNPVPAINCPQLIYKDSFIHHTMVRSHWTR